jgi:hypothetical protein
MSYLLRKLHAILANRDLMEVKPQLVYKHTAGRTMSSKEMTEDELDKLIQSLNSDAKSMKDVNTLTVPRPQHFPSADPAEVRMLKKLWAICYQANIVELGGSYGRNYDLLSTWAEKYGHLKKPVNEYKGKDLQKLVSLAESWKGNNEKAAVSKGVKRMLGELGIELLGRK